MSEHWKTLVAWLLVLVAVALGIALSIPEGGTSVQSPVLQEEVPPFTPEIKAMLEKSNGFAVLVSYTNSGFEPAQADIKKGETVRFTNNSSHDLWVAAKGEQGRPVYPGTSDCGASALDSCKTLKPKEFWEFTFGKNGTWLFQNNLDKVKTGTVRVEVR